MTHWCRWEYKVLVFAHEDGRHNATPTLGEVEAKLNELGAEGWEVFSDRISVMLLKRQHPVMPAAQRAPQRPMPDLVRGETIPADFESR